MLNKSKPASQNSLFSNPPFPYLYLAAMQSHFTTEVLKSLFKPCMVNAQRMPFQLKILYEKFAVHKTKLLTKDY